MSFKGNLTFLTLCFIEVTSFVYGNFRGVSNKLQGCFRYIARVFQSVSRVIQGSFKQVLMGFQEGVKKVSSVS